MLDFFAEQFVGFSAHHFDNQVSALLNGSKIIPSNQKRPPKQQPASKKQAEKSSSDFTAPMDGEHAKRSPKELKAPEIIEAEIVT